VKGGSGKGGPSLKDNGSKKRKVKAGRGYLVGVRAFLTASRRKTRGARGEKGNPKGGRAGGGKKG